MNDDIAGARVALGKGADPNAPTPHYEHGGFPAAVARGDSATDTPLLWAVKNSSKRMAELVLREGGADINLCRLCDGLSPIAAAVRMSDIPMICLLLDNNADADLCGCDHKAGNALMAAVANNLFRPLQYLLERAAGPLTCRCTDLLMAASHGGNVDIARLLIKRGADVRAEHLNGRTALGNAAMGGHVELVELLLDSGANPNVPMHIFGISPGTTALTEAAVFGHTEVVVALLRHGVNPDQRRDDGCTALIAAAAACREATVRVLLDRNADPGIQCTDDGSTAMLCAAGSGNFPIVEALVKAGANPNTACTGPGSNVAEGTPLMEAIAEGHTKIAKYLANLPGIDANAVGYAGQTALILAGGAAHPSLSLIQQLQLAGGDARHADDDGVTAAYLCGHDHPGSPAAAWLRDSEDWGTVGVAGVLRRPDVVTKFLPTAVVLGTFDHIQKLLSGPSGEERYPKLPPCDATTALFMAAKRGWSPATHALHHRGVREAIRTVLLVSQRTTRLPGEMWSLVCTFFVRSSWPVAESSKCRLCIEKRAGLQRCHDKGMTTDPGASLQCGGYHSVPYEDYNRFSCLPRARVIDRAFN